MDPHRFDAFAKSWATVARSRRSVVRRLSGSAAALVMAGVLPGRSSAQDATPAASPAAGQTTTEFLYIQSFASGTLRAKDGEPGLYELVLRGGTGQTTYFADRPERQVGVAPTARVLAAIGFDPANPPNAGIVAQTADGERVIIVELLNPRLDEPTSVLTYDVRPLPDYAGAGLSHLTPKQSNEALPETLGPTSLFIDHGGCPYPICGGVCCNTDEGMVCQGHGAYCVSAYQSGVCNGGDICHQRPHTTCNPEGTCYCGSDVEGGGACVAGDPNLCDRHSCTSSGDCAYGKLCFLAGSCCGAGASVCMPLCQD